MFVCKRDLSTLVVVVASVLLLFGDVGSQTILQHRFSYVGFNERMDNPGFSFTGGSSIDGGALQLTPDSQNDVVSLQNTSGRIMYHQPFKLWLADIDKKEEDDIVASFSSYFYINIFRKKEWNAGEGLTFLIAPTADVPDQSWGQWMGLTNATTDGDSRNQIVAIEFDTEKQDFDPDNNHIGLNINSIRSRKTVSLNKSGIDLSPEIGTNYSIWVEYDGKAKRLQVYMSINKAPKPDKPLLNEEINLKQYVKQESYIGFSASTGSPEIQLNCVLEWTLDLEHLPEKKDLTWLKILAGVGIPVLTIAILIGVWLFVGYRKKRRQSRDEESNVQGTLKRLPGMPREFKYKELKRATHNFHESMVLGNGGFGIVYKGVLQEKDRENTTSTNSIDRLEIAVKKFSRDNIKSKGDFLDELTIIHRLRHRNLVRLEGWCYEKGKLLLVYDFMPNGSLENHLYDVADQNVLNWRHRYKILVGVASALHYLHNEYDQTVLHRDIKSSNILLDSDFNARLGDFGLARALDPERNSYADLQCGGVAGTMGYVVWFFPDPESPPATVCLYLFRIFFFPLALAAHFHLRPPPSDPAPAFWSFNSDIIMDARCRSTKPTTTKVKATSTTVDGDSTKASDALALPLYFTNAVFFTLFFSVVYYLLSRWREKIRNSTPLHFVTPSEIVALVSLVASFVYLIGFFGIDFVQSLFLRPSADVWISEDDDDRSIVKDDSRKVPCGAAIDCSVPEVPPTVLAVPKSVDPLPVPIKLNEEDEEIVKSVVVGTTPSYSLESKLGDCTRAAAIRREALQRITGKSLFGLPLDGFDYDSILGQCCEMPVGYIQIPVGIAGPLLLDGREFSVPMATTEGCLVASTNRGCKAIHISGGANSVLLKDGMTRAPVVRFATAKRAAQLKMFLEEPENFETLSLIFNKSSRFARLQSIKCAIAGKNLYVRFSCSTGDAMGMNMVSKGVQNVLDFLQEDFPDMDIIGISGNFCSDKKPAAVNWVEGRGKSVVCEAIIKGEVVRKVLKTKVEALVELNMLKNLAGSAIAGALGGFNAHASNIVTAIYIATGQDPAQNVESSHCITMMEAVNDGNDLHVSVTMPSIEVGTVGGGTQLGSQSACLNLLGVKGANREAPGSNARLLATIVAGSVLAGELSLMSALAAGQLVKSHMKYNRSIRDIANVSSS